MVPPGSDSPVQCSEAAEAFFGLGTGRVGLLGGLANCIREPITWRMYNGARRSENLESKLWSP